MDRVLLSSSSIGNISSQFYVPNYVTEQEEKTLIRMIEQAPKPKWTQLSNRALQNWGGLPGGRNGKDGAMLEEPIPDWLENWCKKLKESLFIERSDGDDTKEVEFFQTLPNHILINKYFPGQGIFPHEDGPIYEPFVAVLSLNSGLLLDIYKRGDDSALEEQGSVWMGQRSLWVMTEEVYSNYLHGIKEVTEDSFTNINLFNPDEIAQHGNEKSNRETRYSLTFRVVKKTKKLPKFFFKNR